MRCFILFIIFLFLFAPSVIAPEGGGSDSGGGGGGGGGSCFLAGTKISMSDGTYKNIEDVKLYDEVKVFNEQTNQITSRQVLELQSPIREGYYRLWYGESGEVNVTNEHPFYVKKKSGKINWCSLEPDKTHGFYPYLGFVEQIEVGDQIYTENETWLTVTGWEWIEGPIQTYNLWDVQDMHTFFANGLLVHNRDGDGSPSGVPSAPDPTTQATAAAAAVGVGIGTAPGTAAAGPSPGSASVGGPGPGDSSGQGTDSSDSDSDSGNDGGNDGPGDSDSPGDAAGQGADDSDTGSQDTGGNDNPPTIDTNTVTTKVFTVSNSPSINFNNDGFTVNNIQTATIHLGSGNHLAQLTMTSSVNNNVISLPNGNHIIADADESFTLEKVNGNWVVKSGGDVTVTSPNSMATTFLADIGLTPQFNYYEQIQLSQGGMATLSNLGALCLLLAPGSRYDFGSGPGPLPFSFYVAPTDPNFNLCLRKESSQIISTNFNLCTNCGQVDFTTGYKMINSEIEYEKPAIFSPTFTDIVDSKDINNQITMRMLSNFQEIERLSITNFENLGQTQTFSSYFCILEEHDNRFLKVSQTENPDVLREYVTSNSQNNIEIDSKNLYQVSDDNEVTVFGVDTPESIVFESSLEEFYNEVK